MNKIRCLIVDDESIARRIISNYLNDLSGYELVGQCKNAMEALDFLNEHQIDLMFLDIEMPKLQGLNFLKTLANPPSVIVTTAHREYALEGYELEILDYLLKPISFERFIKAVTRFKKTQGSLPIVNSISPPDELQTIYVKSERKTIKLKLSEICYIESMNNYVIIHTNDQKHIVYNSITALLKDLNKNFIRIHKSYVINKSQIKSFNKEEVSLKNISLPIGKTYKQVTDSF